MWKQYVKYLVGFTRTEEKNLIDTIKSLEKAEKPPSLFLSLKMITLK